MALTLGAGHFEHTKFNAFWSRGGEQEAIDTSSARVTAWVGRKASFSVLICKDAVDREALAALKALRVSIVLVAAMSPDTATFEPGLASLASDGQTVSVLANLGVPGTNGTDQVAAALYIKPTKTDGCTRCLPLNGPAPKLWILSP